MNADRFRAGLIKLIDECEIDKEYDVPDYRLAEFIIGSLKANNQLREVFRAEFLEAQGGEDDRGNSELGL